MSEFKDAPEPGGRARLNFAEIKDQLVSNDYLLKIYNDKFLDKMLRDLQGKSGLTDDEKRLFLDNRSAMYFRPSMHVLRMLARPGAEKEFALVYCQNNLDVIFDENRERELKESIINVIGSEGIDTTMFWTFAPYIFRSLKKRGLSEKDAMRVILQWAENGVSVINFYRHKDDSYGLSHLRGLEFLGKNQYILSENADDISHGFTAQEAERIADMLLQNREK